MNIDLPKMFSSVQFLMEKEESEPVLETHRTIPLPPSNVTLQEQPISLLGQPRWRNRV